MKKLLLVAAIFSIATTTNAQQTKVKMKSAGGVGATSFSLGVEGAVPMGKFNDEGYKFGIGGSVQVAYKVAQDLALTLGAGYLNHKNHFTSYDAHFTTIPVLAGVKYWLSPKFYIHPQLGAAFNTFKPSNSTIKGYNSTGFAYSPGLGIYLSKNIDLLVKYFGNSINNGTNSNYQRSSVGARLAYNF